MTKQQPLVRGGDSAYFGPGRRSWVYAIVDTVHISGNHRRYDVTVVADGSKHYGVHSTDVKKRTAR